MADVHSKETRNYNMSRTKGKNTKAEMLVRKFLHVHAYRYHLHDKASPANLVLPARPVRQVLPKYRTVIFVHGCFWQGQEGCKYYVVPKTRTEWWLNKINVNIANDTKAAKALRKDGWRIINIWSCKLKKTKSKITLENLIVSINTQ